MIFEEALRPEAFRILSNRNLERQHAFMLDSTELALEHLPKSRLVASYISELNAIATAGLCSAPGRYRDDVAYITGSSHRPPDPDLIEGLIGDLCVSVREHWNDTDAIDLASFVIWRLTWIHPFADGNGRTADAVGYSVLCRKLGFMLPGPNPVPTYWHDNRDTRYYEALSDADREQPQLPTGPTALSELLGRAVLNQIKGIANSDRTPEN